MRSQPVLRSSTAEEDRLMDYDNRSMILCKICCFTFRSRCEDATGRRSLNALNRNMDRVSESASL